MPQFAEASGAVAQVADAAQVLASRCSEILSIGPAGSPTAILGRR